MIYPRFLLVRKGCPHCRKVMKVVNRINPKLPFDRKIKIIDCFEYEEFGLKNIPLMNVFGSIGLNEGYPFFYLDGIVVEPPPTPEQLNIFLKTFLKKELII
ncbi:MAG: hypothetical protein KKB31_05750 [Nanoarchaeota archaeon]|nr:hypothetical protein [Nanoarchaeota archaeon]